MGKSRLQRSEGGEWREELLSATLTFKSATSSPARQAPGSPSISSATVLRDRAAQFTHIPKRGSASVNSLQGNPALHPESFPLSPASSKVGLHSPPTSHPLPTPLPQIRRIKEDGAGLTIHRNLDGPAEAEEAEQEGCVDPGRRLLLPGHPQYWAPLPAPRPAGSCCLQQL